MKGKFKFGLFVGFVLGAFITILVGVLYQYPESKIDNAMEICNKQFNVGPSGLDEDYLDKYSSIEAFEEAYTACVNEAMK